MRTMKLLALIGITYLSGCGGGGGGSKVVSPVITVAVTPANPTVGTGVNETFNASVTGTSNTAVDWTIQEGTAGGTISAVGVYQGQTPGTYHIIATSKANAAFIGATTVTVVAPNITITVSPNNPTVIAGVNQTFTAKVTGISNTAVNWSILEGAAGGVIGASGIYNCKTPGTFHIVATSKASLTVTGTTTVTVVGGNIDGSIQ